MEISIITSIASLVISILSLIVAIWYKRKHLKLAKAQLELAQEALEEQKRRQQFSAKITDTYYHRAEDGRLEYLGAILSLDNPSGSSIFIRYLEITLIFHLSTTHGLSFWQYLLWLRNPEAMKLTIPCPPDGSGSISGQGFSFRSLPVWLLQLSPPQSWVFDRRTDNVITFQVPVEIRSKSPTVLWELVIYLPPMLWKTMQKYNLDLRKLNVLLVLSDGHTQELEAKFEPRFGLEASSRQRVIELIRKAQPTQSLEE